ncbi:MAG TPA: hypothetical protein PLP29_18210 [Candidatus Ozemobacteraceae bacterium]|nr:hypothetical protein [Candidatus Ozemobacteraceae bacterium]
MKRTALALLTALTGILLAGAVTPAAAAQTSRLRYLGSSNITLPTAYFTRMTTYTSDDGHNMIMYAQPFGKFLELSGVRHMNDAESGKTVLNFKMTVLEEDKLFPNIVWGVGDAGMTLGSRVFYFAGSKTFESFAASIHGGIIKDPVTTEKKSFIGAEKTILPLVILAAERCDGLTSYGLKMRPYPGVSLEYARRDDGNGGNDTAIYQIQYIKSF